MNQVKVYGADWCEDTQATLGDLTRQPFPDFFVEAALIGFSLSCELRIIVPGRADLDKDTLELAKTNSRTGQSMLGSGGSKGGFGALRSRVTWAAKGRRSRMNSAR